MEKVLKFLRENSVCCLATCSKDMPRASTMEYIIIDDVIFFATSADSIKANNLKANNKISFAAYTMPKFVTIDGTTEAPTKEEIDEYKKILFERHPEFKDMTENGMMKSLAYYKIVPGVVYYNDYTSGIGPAEVIECHWIP